MRAFILLAMMGVAAAVTLPASYEMPRYPKVNLKHSFDMVKNHHQKAMEIVHAQHAKHATQDWTACAAAFGAWSVIEADGTCGALMAAVFNYDKSVLQADFDDSIDQFCDSDPSSCSSQIIGTLTDIADSCSDIWEDPSANEDFVVAIRQFVSVVRIPCVRDDANTEFCAKAFFTAATSDDGSDAVSQDELDALCVPCVAKMFQTFASFSSDEDAIRAGLWINLVCLQVDGEFCFVYMQDAFPDDSSSSMTGSGPTSTSASSSDDGDFVEFLGALCHPCVKLVVDYLSVVFNVFDVEGACNALDNSGDCEDDMADDIDCNWSEDDTCEPDFDSGETTGMLALLCGKNEDNELCLVNFFTAVGGFPEDTCPADDEEPPKDCSAKCAKAVNGLADTLGCCAGYIDDYLNLPDDDDDEKTDAELKQEADFNNFIMVECANPDFDDDYPECPNAGLTGRFAILNFASDYFNDHRDDIIAWIILDIALSAGTDANNIVVEDSDVDIDEDGKVTVSYSITVTNNDEANYISITVMGNMNLAKTSSEVPPEGKEDFTAALEVSDAEVTVEEFSADDWEEPEADGAATLVVSALAVIVPAVLLL